MRNVILSGLMLGMMLMTLTQTHGEQRAGSPLEQLESHGYTPQDIDAAAIEQLRNMGPAGLAAILAHPPMTTAGGNNKGDLAVLTDYRAAIDAVACQRDAATSGLYWYTDLEQAKAAAKASGKPILSLRMLGKLTDEFSCANSRFFRTVLYANKEVSRVLQRDYILHWQSVRPVPKVTIDFGDGRKIERTITGNSIHYVLDTQGRPVDALPGLYGPKAFLRGLAAARNFAMRSNSLEGSERQAMLASYHEQQVQVIASAWAADMENIRLVPPTEVSGGHSSVKAAPLAATAGRVTTSKFAGEMPVIRALQPEQMAALESSLNDQQWARIAAVHAADAALDEGSIEVIRQQNPNAFDASKRARSKAFVENPLLRVVRQFQNTVAIDTVRNEYLLHRKIHEWFAAGQLTRMTLNGINEKVYAELFLTPSTDPWLGLAPQDAYTALEHDGLIVKK